MFTVDRAKVKAGWDGLRLSAAQIQQLREISGALNAGKGAAVLLSGPPGVGKAVAAQLLAAERGRPLHRVDLKAVVSRYIGETEKNLEKLFDAAQAADAVLFFDEADALFGKRSAVKDSHDRYANIEVNYLLVRMEHFSGLLVLATSMKANIDPAFLRRFRYVIDFPVPVRA